jgi:hypothetical protein
MSVLRDVEGGEIILTRCQRVLFGNILMEEDSMVDMSPFSLWTHPIKLKCCECSVQDGVSAEGFLRRRIFEMMTAARAKVENLTAFIDTTPDCERRWPRKHRH